MSALSSTMVATNLIPAGNEQSVVLAVTMAATVIGTAIVAVAGPAVPIRS